MKCPRCRGTQISVSENVVMQSKKRSFLWNLLMILITGGLWLIWMLVRKKKEKMVHVKMAVCQECGKSWKLR